MYFVLKTLLTSIVIVSISELAKKFSFLGGILASLPLTSILAFVWMYQDNKDISGIINLSYIIFWMVIPSLFFFIIFPYLLKKEINFYPSLLLSVGLMFIFYSGFVFMIKKLGINI